MWKEQLKGKLDILTAYPWFHKQITRQMNCIVIRAYRNIAKSSQNKRIQGKYDLLYLYYDIVYNISAIRIVILKNNFVSTIPQVINSSTKTKSSPLDWPWSTSNFLMQSLIIAFNCSHFLSKSTPYMNLFPHLFRKRALKR